MGRRRSARLEVIASVALLRARLQSQSFSAFSPDFFGVPRWWCRVLRSRVRAALADSVLGEAGVGGKVASLPVFFDIRIGSEFLRAE